MDGECRLSVALAPRDGICVMKKASLANDYLSLYAAGLPWSLNYGYLDNIKQVVVIPAYAEKEHLFSTLESLAANPPELLEQSLILCVINNKAAASAADKDNNKQTLFLLHALMTRISGRYNDVEDEELRYLLRTIAASRLRIAYIDASSSGLEIPARAGGVGMARKIGMDMALRLLLNCQEEPRLILSLDADTLVKPSYLPAVRSSFLSVPGSAGAVAFQHQLPREEAGRSAIIRYEIFLRYWVLGLQYAQSPYAFHSIGSTMATTCDAYLAVRGMNRREAGEDFYFLNKLAKTGAIKQIRETVVYPSARVSNRVPFGTGAAVSRIISEASQDDGFYDPRVFLILKEWLALMKQSFDLPADRILAGAADIDRGLELFLAARGFLTVWPKIRSNLKDEKTYHRQFHNWFDGFETLKLVNYLSREFYPRISLPFAVKQILAMQNREYPGRLADEQFPDREDQLKILSYLRGLT